MHSDNIGILEHFGRKLHDAFDALNIVKSKLDDVLRSNLFTDLLQFRCS